ncbi:glycoside hydrolase family protein [Pseudomonas quasicaspiana]|uniref:hypothetical protein n=1 Tax=Pseudomonas quasicaspiana TaxID=2829821 RepID=UPI001E34B5BA|nr:hypothetical protein [Pseudomonas quasicaspiana]MCD5972126.1 hypothetical protein [Pseudomonas quasicaspiana]
MRDLWMSNWEVFPDALWSAATLSCDDYTTWSGYVIRAEANLWMMFYTSTSQAEDGRAQRIGVACSDDLMVGRRSTESRFCRVTRIAACKRGSCWWIGGVAFA